MELMKYSESEWIALRAEARRKYYKEVMRRRWIWQKVNGLIAIAFSVCSWKVWNIAGNILISIPLIILGAWLVATREIINT